MSDWNSHLSLNSYNYIPRLGACFMMVTKPNTDDKMVYHRLMFFEKAEEESFYHTEFLWLVYQDSRLFSCYCRHPSNVPIKKWSNFLNEAFSWGKKLKNPLLNFRNKASTVPVFRPEISAEIRSIYSMITAVLLYLYNWLLWIGKILLSSHQFSPLFTIPMIYEVLRCETYIFTQFNYSEIPFGVTQFYYS